MQAGDGTAVPKAASDATGAPTTAEDGGSGADGANSVRDAGADGDAADAADGVGGTCTTAGPRRATIAASLGIGIAWASPANALTADGLSASSLIDQEKTQRLVLTGFGFSLPANAQVTGIVLSVRKRAGQADEIWDSFIGLERGGAPGAVSRAAQGDWPATFVTTTYGSATDTFGETLSGAAVNALDFGVAIVALHDAGTGESAFVDDVTMLVHYCSP
jgi:hypothetical protein